MKDMRCFPVQGWVGWGWLQNNIRNDNDFTFSGTPEEEPLVSQIPTESPWWRRGQSINQLIPVLPPLDSNNSRAWCFPMCEWAEVDNDNIITDNHKRIVSVNIHWWIYLIETNDENCPYKATLLHFYLNFELNGPCMWQYFYLEIFYW